MSRLTHPFRSLSLVLAFSIAHDVAFAQLQCGGSSLTGDISVVSVTTGGVQNLGLTISPADIGYEWHLIGSFAGTLPGLPYFSFGGLFLNQDRYMNSMVTGHSQLVQGAPANIYGVIPSFDLQGHASLQVVVPPALYPMLIGRTVHHGFYRFNPISLLPDCGSNTVALTFVP